MADWILTATTIYCDAIDDEVTLIIDKDGMLKCTGYTKYGKPDKEAARSVKAKSKRLGKQLRCEGLECHRAIQYRNKLSAEEGRPDRSAQSE